MRKVGVALSGPMASGKSTVGPVLAARLGYDFVDLDRHIEVSAGMSVADLFRTEGEAGFRAREHTALGEVAGRERCVVALGGGTLHARADHRALLHRHVVVWLQVAWSSLSARLASGGRTRPLADRARELYRSRMPELVAPDVIVDADRPPDALVEDLVQRLEGMLDP